MPHAYRFCMQNRPEPTKHEVIIIMDTLFDRAQVLAQENELLRVVRDAATDVLYCPGGAVHGSAARKRLREALDMVTGWERERGGAR